MIELYIKKYPYEKGPAELGHEVAYELLDAVYREKFNTPPPKTKKSETGKPCFIQARADKKCFFNISHSKGYAAVLLTDGAECGVDIEPDADPKKMEKIKGRFLSEKLPTKAIEENITVRTDGFSEGASIQKYSVSDTEALPPVALWTILEAVLKADGRGFAAFSERKRLAEGTKAATFVLNDGDKTVYLTVAIKA